MLRSLPLLVLGLPAFAQGGFVETPLVLEGHGVICEVTLEGRREAPGTESGILNIIDQEREIDVITTAVPAEIGLSFGIRATLEPGHALDDLWVVVEHPPMGPNAVTVERWQAEANAGATMVNLFTFEHDYERVQGSWVFKLVSGDTTLLEQRFTVFPAGTVPAVQQTCFGAKLMG